MTFEAPLPYGGRDVEGFAAGATLNVFLNRQGEGQDVMSAADFLAATGKFLERTGLRSVYDVWFDHRVVYRVAEDREAEDNHGEAISKALESVRPSKEIGVWAHGVSGDFYLEVRLRLRKVRDESPPLVLEIAGNPIELTNQTGQGEFELDDELTNLESNKEEIAQKNVEVRGRFVAKVHELRDMLGQFFSVQSVGEDVKVDVGSIW